MKKSFHCKIHIILHFSKEQGFNKTKHIDERNGDEH